MSTLLASPDSEPASAAGIAHARSQISAAYPLLPRRARRAAGLVAVVLLAGACSSSLQLNPDGAATSCADITQAYSDAVMKAQECTVVAGNQCGFQVRASFWCNCMTWVNGGTDKLTAIANQYNAAGCQSVCTGICVQPQALTCQADTTSSTGGRCLAPMLVNLNADNDGGTFAVPVGYEIDITLGNIGINGYQMNVMLSSDAVTVLEINIPAGPANPGGPTYIYRLKAVSAGQVVVQIPHLELPDASQSAAYTITLNIS